MFILCYFYSIFSKLRSYSVEKDDKYHKATLILVTFDTDKLHIFL